MSHRIHIWLLALATVLHVSAASAQQLHEINTDDLDVTVLSFDDDGSPNGLSWEVYSPLATTFVAPFDCQIIAYQLYWEGNTSEDVRLEVQLFADNSAYGNSPSGESLFVITDTIQSRTNSGWRWIDVRQANVTLQAGEVFHPAWSYSTQTRQVDFGTGLDTSSNQTSGSCWYTSEDGQWMDASDSWTHMVRVVVIPVQ